MSRSNVDAFLSYLAFLSPPLRVLILEKNQCVWVVRASGGLTCGAKTANTKKENAHLLATQDLIAPRSRCDARIARLEDCDHEKLCHIAATRYLNFHAGANNMGVVFSFVFRLGTK